MAAIACAILSTTGLVASSFIRSPAQALADTAAPEASVLTAPVERRVLASTVVTRGNVVADRLLEVTPPDTGGVALQVITSVKATAGAEIHAGEVAVAVSGRPLIALAGAVPGYRDLRPGNTGPDVTQLQTALRALGHYRGNDKKGYFGSGTKAAVRKLYGALGYEPSDTGGPGGFGDRAALDSAAAAVEEAQGRVDEITRSISAGDEAEPGQLSLAQQLSLAEKALKRARTDQSQLVSRTGTMLPLGEFFFVPNFPAKVAALNGKVGDLVKPPLIVISTGDLAIEVKLRPNQAALLKVGMPVTVISEALGTDAAGAITSISGTLTDTIANDAAQSGQALAQGAPYHLVRITPKDPLGGEWAGQDVRITITAAETATRVLVVPLSAVSASADGRTTVSIWDGRTVERVEVRAGVSGDGFVEVTPVSGELNDGDRVVVGERA